jgi:hypothetical protein
MSGVAFDGHPNVFRGVFWRSLQHMIMCSLLIDLLCEQMHQAQLPLRIVRVMWNLLWRKEIVFYYENQPIAECVGFKGLLQGSALSPFSYSFLTSQTDRVLPFCCSYILMT